MNPIQLTDTEGRDAAEFVEAQCDPQPIEDTMHDKLAEAASPEILSEDCLQRISDVVTELILQASDSGVAEKARHDDAWRFI